MSVASYISGRWANILGTLAKNNLWERMLKNTLATSLVIGISLIHYNTKPAFGKAAYLSAMVSVFAHPGRRFGQLVEALVLVLIGLVLGVAWALFGLWLSSLVFEQSPSAAYTIRGIFLAFALMYHGFFRSHTPRIYLLLLVFIIENITALTTTSPRVTTTLVEQLVYPILMAVGILLFVNVAVFPEFSSSYLGETTIDGLEAAALALRRSGGYFVGESGPVWGPKSENTQPTQISTVEEDLTKTKSSPSQAPALNVITAMKDSLRSNLSATRNAQNDTQFEIAYAHIPPRLLSPISKKRMKRLVAHIIAVIGTCESRFALLGDGSSQSGITHPKDPLNPSLIEAQDGAQTKTINLNSLKPRKEIEFGDVRLLRYLLARIKAPYLSFQTRILEAIEFINSCITYAYDVRKLYSRFPKHSSTSLEELDKLIASLQAALETFDADITATLESAATLEDLHNEDLDIMPREEIFLIASFLLNVRQAATQVLEMLQTCRCLVQLRSEGTKWRGIFLPDIKWRKWLYSGGETDEAIPASDRRIARQRSNTKHESSNKKVSTDGHARTSGSGDDPEAGQDSSFILKNSKSVHLRRLDPSSILRRGRQTMADLLAWAQHSEDLSYAFKLTIATFLVTFPALVPDMNTFYSQRRGSWAALQLIFVFDVAIGTSIWNAYIRSIGTTLGSLWGWAAYAVGNGNPYACVFMLFIGLIPSTYVQLGSQYAKAGMVTIVSMSVVALATELQTIPGTSTENFLNRWIAFMIGGVVALVVEMVLLPVKARTRLIEALTATIRQIGDMEGCIGYGIDEGSDLRNGFPPHVFKSFETASSKAKASLADADTFFPFCSTEPRLKGSFKAVAKIYKEVMFVLRQIVDKMDNMVQLRLAYGSGPIEELNAVIYPYRRNVAGSVSLILYTLHEALVTKYPLPQFIPSARLAHLRLINRIREVVQQGVGVVETRDGLQVDAIKRTLRRKYMSWNAASAAQAEIIEYLEELSALVKLLVGASEFRSGLLARPTLQEYARVVENSLRPEELSKFQSSGGGESHLDGDLSQQISDSAASDLPLSLRRIHSRKEEASIRKRQMNETQSRARSGSG